MNEYVYIEIREDLYGIPQASELAYEKLETKLKS